MKTPTEGEEVPWAGIDLGVPGRSALDQFERRRHADAGRRRERYGRHLAPVVKLLTGERRTTITWRDGGVGEERLGHYLAWNVGSAGPVLNDRIVPARRSNIDHIVVVQSGIWVIDAKRYQGRVECRNLGGRIQPQHALFVNGRNRTALIPAVLGQMMLVRQVVGEGVPMQAALCFADPQWSPSSRPFRVDGVVITKARWLASSLRRAGPLDRDEIGKLARQIASALPSFSSSRCRCD